jgi:hypothetical protein
VDARDGSRLIHVKSMFPYPVSLDEPAVGPAAPRRPEPCPPNRLTAVLGSYDVRDTSCLADPGLVALAQDYRRKAAARLMPLAGDRLKKTSLAKLTGR